MLGSKCAFWMVYTKTGNNPKFSHGSYNRACVEAERLANANPGKTFIVVKGIRKFKVPVVAADNVNIGEAV